MKKVLAGLVILGLGFGMSGCAINAGNAKITKKENVKQLRVYKSSQSQVRQILGEPNSIMMLDGGKEKWTYQHTGGTANVGNLFKQMYFIGGVGGGGSPSNTKMTILALTFNARGILIRKKFGY